MILIAGKKIILPTVMVLMTAWMSFPAPCLAEDVATREEEKKTSHASAESEEQPRFFIHQYKVSGAKRLPRGDVEKAVYPFLGPYRTSKDIDDACAALEKAYKEKGFQTVAVQAHPRPNAKGVVTLYVSEVEVGRLRVKGSRYFSLEQIKQEAPSVAEGTLPDFNDVTRDILALNRIPDRRVTPAINAGREPGKIDVDLMVKDTFPLHGNVELNNRYSADTTSLRLNTSLSYANLWQIGHTVGLSYQLSPMDVNQVQSLFAYYSAPVPDIDGLTLTLQGSEQNSKVSTLGTIDSIGGGETVGVRATLALPGKKGFYHSAILGFDYKYADQSVTIGGNTADAIRTPVTYFPWSANYSASWLGTEASTELNGGVTFNVRGLGSDSPRFDARRHSADANFIYFRGDISHTRELPEGFQFFTKVQGQIADRPLITNEQFGGGGLDTARGYLESLVTGDNAIFGTLEMRTPSVGGYIWQEISDWRFFVFTDAGQLVLKNPLPEEISHFDMASWGAGSRMRINEHFNGALTYGVPMIHNPQYKGPERLLTFRLWYDF